MRNHIDNFTASLGKRYKERSRPRCAANVQRRPGPQWLPRIGNNHGLVMARLRFDALNSVVDSCGTVSCAPVKECERSKGCRNNKRLCRGYCCCGGGIVVLADVSFVAIISHTTRKECRMTRIFVLCVMVLLLLFLPLAGRCELSFEACRETKS